MYTADIGVKELMPHPNNPRKDLGDLTELAASIKANGILQNLVVVPNRQAQKYMVVIGHRRLAAAKLAGLDVLPCSVCQMTEEEQLQTMLMENIQRNDLTVYEQAQGFQQLLDFGTPIEDIAAKTGFSVPTIRRRTKLMELDQKKLAAAARRQPTLADFDELNKIKDISARNEVLQYIGTKNFDINLTMALDKQRCKENVVKIQEFMVDHDITLIPHKATWGTKYTWVGLESISDWGKKPIELPEDKGPLFFDITNAYVEIYALRENAAPKSVQPSPEEVKRADANQAAWDQLTELGDAMKKTRSSFIRKLKITKANEATILKGALLATLYAWHENYNVWHIDTENVLRHFGKNADAREEFFGEMKNLDEVYQKLPVIVYEFFGDNDCFNIPTADWNHGDPPEFIPQVRLQMLYRWLIELGYTMSDMETELIYGTSEIYAKNNA